MSDGTSVHSQPALKPAPRDARNVLVIRSGPLPAFLQALAPAKAIRAHHVQARITLLTVPEFAELAKACPYFDEVETDAKPGIDPSSLTKLVQRLRKAKYDIVYDLEGASDTSRLFQLLRPFPPKWSGPVEGAWHKFAPADGAAMHPLDRYALQMKEVGIGPPDGYPIGMAPLPDVSWVRAVLRNPPRLRPSHFGLVGPFILIAPGASDKGDQRWSGRQYNALAKLISARGVTPVITGAQEERGLGGEIAGSDGKAKNIVGRADLFQQIALAEDCNFVVGDDSDPIHLSAAAGAPLLVFLPRGADPYLKLPRSKGGAAFFTVGDFKSMTPEEVDLALLNLGAYSRRAAP